jgi:PAS domain-containing protein
MKRNIGKYSLSALDAEGKGCLVSIREEGTLLYSFCVKPEYLETFVEMLQEKESLIVGPRHINLFETEALEDHIPKEWLCEEEPSAHFALEEDVLASFVKSAKLKGKKLSDESILFEMQEFFSLSPEQYDAAIESLERVRDVGNISYASATDLDGFIAASSKDLLAKAFRVFCEELPKIAFGSRNWKEFMRAVVSFERSLADSFEYVRDGFVARLCITGDSVTLNIEYAGICLAYNGYMKSNIPSYKEILVLEDEVFWNDVWYELYGLHREHLLKKEEEERRVLEEKIAHLEQQLKERFYEETARDAAMSYTQIAQEYSKRFGISYSEQTFSGTVKKALGKMQEYLAQKNPHIEEYVCL